MGAFANKTFVIVGAGRGIGRATALALAKEGARLVLDDSGCDTDGQGHDPKVIDDVVAEVRALGSEALGFALDASEKTAIARLAAAARDAFGSLDGGFYAAGISRERAILRTRDEDLDALIDVHFKGAFRFVRDLGQALVEQRKGGSLLIASSPSAFFGTANQAGLAATAGAVASLARTAATELRRHGIRVNAILPTARTRLTEHLPLFQSIRPDSLRPEFVAQVACHLLGDASVDVHGELVGVAGGRTYAYRMSETSGLFRDGGPLDLGVLAESFREVTRS